MARGHFYRALTDEDGNLIPNVTLEVRRETAGLPLVAVQNRAGDNLGSTPMFPLGVANFYVLVGGFFRLHVTAAGYDETFYDVPIASGAGTDADALVGAAFNMAFETEVAAPPSSGSIRADNADLSAATELYVSETNAAGSDFAARLAELVTDDRILITASDGTQVSFNVDSAGVSDSGAYATIAVTGHAGETALSAGSVSLQLQRKGQDGADGAGTVAAVVAGEGIDVDSSDPTQPIVSAEAASTTNAGIAEIATAAEYRAGTDTGRVLGVDEAWNAAELAVLTDGATIAVDFATGLNFGQASNAPLALGGNRELGAPSNLKTGQSGVLWFTASGSTRTLTLNAAWLLATGVETGPYSITTSQILGVAYWVLGSTVWVTAILRRG